MSKNSDKLDYVSNEKMQEIEKCFEDLGLNVSSTDTESFCVQQPKDFKIVSGLDYNGEYVTTSSGSVSPFEY